VVTAQNRAARQGGPRRAAAVRGRTDFEAGTYRDRSTGGCRPNRLRGRAVGRPAPACTPSVVRSTIQNSRMPARKFQLCTGPLTPSPAR
jgi:hypothetical protein